MDGAQMTSTFTRHWSKKHPEPHFGTEEKRGMDIELFLSLVDEGEGSLTRGYSKRKMVRNVVMSLLTIQAGDEDAAEEHIVELVKSGLVSQEEAETVIGSYDELVDDPNHPTHISPSEQLVGQDLTLDDFRAIRDSR